MYFKNSFTRYHNFARAFDILTPLFHPRNVCVGFNIDCITGILQHMINSGVLLKLTQVLPIQDEIDISVAIKQFQICGLENLVCQKLCSEPKLGNSMLGMIHTANIRRGCTKELGRQLYHILLSLPEEIYTSIRVILAQYLVRGDIRNDATLDALLAIIQESQGDFDPADIDSIIS